MIIPLHIPSREQFTKLFLEKLTGEDVLIDFEVVLTNILEIE